MYRKIEALGASLLSRFVPSVDASATGTLACYCYRGCWQCAGSACCINTSCGSLNCSGRCPGC